MSSNTLKIGAHFGTEKGLIGAVDACETIGANAIQVFFKSPMNMRNKIKLKLSDTHWGCFYAEITILHTHPDCIPSGFKYIKCFLIIIYAIL